LSFREYAKFFIVVRKYAKSIYLSVHGNFGDYRVVLFLYKVVSEYAKSILACMENSSKDLKRIRRNFVVHGEYDDRYKTKPNMANFRPKQKNQIPNHAFLDITEWDKPSQATVP
jgi:hypothetical protein